MTNRLMQVIGAAVVMSSVGLGAVMCRPQRASANGDAVLRVKRIEIVDKSECKRLSLGEVDIGGQGGAYGMEICDSKGAMRSVWGVRDDGSQSISLWGGKGGAARVFVSVSVAGTVDVGVTDIEGIQRIRVRVTPEGKSIISTLKQDGDVVEAIKGDI